MEIVIQNDRKIQDYAELHVMSWAGMEQGNDEYPKRGNYQEYLIAGGKTAHFRAKHVEIFGVNI